MSKQYENYKDSGIAWLGEVPAHWEVTKIKHVADSVQTGNTPPTEVEEYFENGEFNWFTPADFGDNLLLTNSKRKISDVALNAGVARVFKPKSVLMVGIGATLGKIGLCEEICSANQQVNAITFEKGFNPYFGAYFLKAFSDVIVSQSTASTLAILNQSKTGELIIVNPPESEKEAIADYLNYKTGQIDKLIAQKEDLMNLLQKKRQAIINEAVTQGLNTNAPRRDSGIEWLGEIPAHWEVKKLKYVATINPGKDSELYEESVTFLPMEKVGETGVVDYTLRRPIGEVSTGFTYFEKDDVIVAKITPCFENGKGAHLCDMETNVGFGSTEFHVLRTNDLIDPAYLYLITTSDRFRNLGEASMTGSAGQKRVPTSFIENFIIPLPPLEEQLQIREIIDHKKDLTSTSLGALADQIKKLKLYRQSVINEVVTGKVDVREVVLNEV